MIEPVLLHSPFDTLHCAALQARDVGRFRSSFIKSFAGQVSVPPPLTKLRL